MNVRVYQAESMPDALAQVKRQLGRDAVILNTRTVKKGGLLGFGGKTIVEITAASGINVLHPTTKRDILSRGTVAESANRRESPLRRPEKAGPSDAGQTSQLRQELELVKQMVQEVLHDNRRRQHPAVPDELFATYLSLINGEVAEEVAAEIVREVTDTLNDDQLADEPTVRQALTACVEQMIPTAEPITAGTPGQPRVIAFVGPTGVGKTTTIAKLAANFALREGKSVGLITIDTYRIAAVDQLRTYANIINIPLRVVLSPDELRQAIDAMQDCHLILIDTAGRSQQDHIKLRELKSFMKRVKPDEIHLVLSTTSSQSNMQANIEKFSALGIDRIIFTKLDEAVGIGMVFNVMRKLDRSISYITTGQNVPDDIEASVGRQLASLLVTQCDTTDNARTTHAKPKLRYGT